MFFFREISYEKSGDFTKLNFKTTKYLFCFIFVIFCVDFREISGRRIFHKFILFKFVFREISCGISGNFGEINFE